MFLSYCHLSLTTITTICNDELSCVTGHYNMIIFVLKTEDDRMVAKSIHYIVLNQ